MRVLILSCNAKMSWKLWFYTWQELLPNWRRARSATIDSLDRLIQQLQRKSLGMDISGTTGRGVIISGVILFLLCPLGLPFLALGVTLATGGAGTGAGTTFTDKLVTSRSKTEDIAIMQTDEKASRRFRSALWELGVTSGRLSTWARQHPQEVSKWTEVPLDDALTMCGVFSTIRGAGHADGYVPEQSNIFIKKSAVSKAAHDIHYRVVFLMREVHALNYIYERCSKFME